MSFEVDGDVTLHCIGSISRFDQRRKANGENKRLIPRDEPFCGINGLVALEKRKVEIIFGEIGYVTVMSCPSAVPLMSFPSNKFYSAPPKCCFRQMSKCFAKQQSKKGFSLETGCISNIFPRKSG